MRAMNAGAVLLVLLSIQVVAVAQSRPAVDARPDVLFVLLDDAGWTDFSCMGGPHATPHVDALAAEGRRFTQFQTAQAVCSASRAAILTGCYPNRIGMLHALMPEAKIGLADEETTLAESLKSVGYATGVFGKWHLGDKTPFRPLRHGFDAWYGIPYSNDMWAERARTEPAARAYPPLPIWRDDAVVGTVESMEDQAKLTRDITSAAVSFIKNAADRPYFCFVPYPQPHMPIAASPEHRGKSATGPYGDVMREIDASIGRLLDAVDARGRRNATLVVVTSDNGPWLVYGDHAGTCNGLREGKGTMWEGGSRVPLIVRWPGRVAAGTVATAHLATVDLFPTLTALLGSPRGTLPIDGYDMSPTFLGDAEAPPRPPHVNWYGNDLVSIREGRWKLVFPHTFSSVKERGKEGRPGKMQAERAERALYDLERDPIESEDVAKKHPDVVARLERVAEAARAALGDALTKRRGTETRPSGRVP